MGDGCDADKAAMASKRCQPKEWNWVVDDDTEAVDDDYIHVRRRDDDHVNGGGSPGRGGEGLCEVVGDLEPPLVDDVPIMTTVTS
jgi:hypothetical protein